MKKRGVTFRAWDKRDKRMLYQDDIKISYAQNTDIYLTDLCTFFDSLNDRIYKDGFKVSDGIPDNRYILLENTGLTDKNGKDIYEGDIIEYHPKKPEVIGFEDGSFIQSFVGRDPEEDGAVIILNKYSVTRSVILGNIYENPELLK